jgi:ABC-2 type transport system ATP-binding protein
MAWGTLNVDEQRARFEARQATVSPRAPARRHFLIANLELEFNVSYIRINDLKFSNRKFPRFFILSHKGLAVREHRLTLRHEGLISRRPFCSLVTRHSSPVAAFLIETPRLKIHVTSRKQNQSQFLIETNQALSPAGSSLHGPPAAPAPPQAMPCLAPRPPSGLFRLYVRVKNQMTSAAIDTRDLTRRFGALTAVEDVNLRVAPGQFFGFLGPNGAGKSTTIKMLTGLLAPTAGRVEILGLDLAANSIEVKRQIGVVPEGMALFGRLTGAEYLNFVGRMYGLDRETAAKRAAELLDFMQLADQPKKLVTDYSHGMQKKLALAAAVIHGPKILFLDEPFEGVDAIASGTLKAMLQSMILRGATIFLTSHVLEIVERLCSHLAIIHRGRLVAQGSLEELRAGVEAQAAAALPGDGGHVPVVAAPGEKLTLEEIFLRIVGGARPVDQELSWLS